MTELRQYFFQKLKMNKAWVSFISFHTAMKMSGPGCIINALATFETVDGESTTLTLTGMDLIQLMKLVEEKINI